MLRTRLNSSSYHPANSDNAFPRHTKKWRKKRRHRRNERRNDAFHTAYVKTTNQKQNIISEHNGPGRSNCVCSSSSNSTLSLAMKCVFEWANHSTGVASFVLLISVKYVCNDSVLPKVDFGHSMDFSYGGWLLRHQNMSYKFQRKLDAFSIDAVLQMFIKSDWCVPDSIIFSKKFKQMMKSIRSSTLFVSVPPQLLSYVKHSGKPFRWAWFECCHQLKYRKHNTDTRRIEIVVM